MSESDNNYPYYANILTPAQLGMSPGNSLSNIENGVAGLVNYIHLLVEGTSPASSTGKPLGNRYFLKTNQSCSNTDGSKVTRSLYINNIPTGGLGVLPSGSMGQNFSSFRGLLPGALEDILSLSRIDFMGAFSSMDIPKCQSVTLQTINNKNQIGYDTQYVALSDLNDVPPCAFRNGYNPVTDTLCTEGFMVSLDNENDSDGGNKLNKNKNNKKKKTKNKNKNKNKNISDIGIEINISDKPLRMPDDIFLQIFIYTFGAFWVYVILKLLANMYKKK
jgi:hypothetical protein